MFVTSGCKLNKWNQFASAGIGSVISSALSKPPGVLLNAPHSIACIRLDALPCKTEQAWLLEVLIQADSTAGCCTFMYFHDSLMKVVVVVVVVVLVKTSGS